VSHSNDEQSVAASTPTKPVARRIGGPRVLDSAELFKGASEVLIQHADALYRLKITSQGKLILNK
jgi:hemin uptake protein HemP